jgi:membrane-associated phospholipid phosphatase
VSVTAEVASNAGRDLPGQRREDRRRRRRGSGPAAPDRAAALLSVAADRQTGSNSEGSKSFPTSTAGTLARASEAATGASRRASRLVTSRAAGIFGLLALFAVFAAGAVSGAGIAWDSVFLHELHGQASPWLDRAMLALSDLGSFGALSPIAVGVLALLLFHRRWRDALFLAAATFAVPALNPLLKLLFERPRPALWPRLEPTHGYSFPSGHAMSSAAIIGALVVLAWPTRWRWPALLLGGLVILGVGVSRTYLGVHYPSDVLGGWVIALASVAFLQALRRRGRGSLVGMTTPDRVPTTTPGKAPTATSEHGLARERPDSSGLRARVVEPALGAGPAGRSRAGKTDRLAPARSAAGASWAANTARPQSPPEAQATRSTEANAADDGDLPRGSEPVQLDPADFTTRIDNPY